MVTILFPFEYQGTRLCSARAASPVLAGFFGGKGVGFAVALAGGGFQLFYLGNWGEWYFLVPMIVAGGLAELWHENTHRIKEIFFASIYILLVYQGFHLFFSFFNLERDLGLWLSRLPFDLIVFFVNLLTVIIFFGIIHELKYREDHMGLLEDLALTDEMTNVYNYRYFKRFLEDYLEKCDADKGDNATLLFVDLDNFKAFNDTYGHKEGDKLLKEVAQIFKQSIRPRDVICRYGGDEFAIVLPDTRGKIGLNVAERLRQRLEHKKYAIEGTNEIVTASIGVASYQTWMRVDDLIEAADEALYEAKEKGKNTISPHNSCYL